MAPAEWFHRTTMSQTSGCPRPLIFGAKQRHVAPITHVFLMSTILLPLDYRSIALMVSPINGRSAHETPRRIEEPTKRQQEQVFRNNNEAEGILRRWRLSATPRQRTVSSDWFRRLSSFLRSCFFLVVVVTFSFLFCAPSLSTPFTNGPLL